ncbi:MAG: amino acid decarboxylase [Oscillospiraceae bacterium]|nr:amino acid decarboxylase [Oscillospiraceae bacterium]
MTTPIADFAAQYARTGAVRMHMPGHKGKPVLGCEPADLTEIAGADELFAPAGIIAESEANAGRLFGCRTLYSAEGSSLCIRAMLYLAVLHARETGKKPVIAAARNAHRTFLTAAVLLDFEIRWLPHPAGADYLSGCMTPEQLRPLADDPPAALYLTSPDYLGNLCDIRAAARFCRENGILLLVDNAHGAYLKFLPESLHPADLGADLCCDSAHKTLPVLTGGAYLHIAAHAPEVCKSRARAAMGLFASTSPSYLILQSLDRCNQYLHDGYSAKLRDFLALVRALRGQLSESGWQLCGEEPMKLTLLPKAFGYTGTALAEILQNERIFCEFADRDHLVLMPSPENTRAELHRVGHVLCGLPRRSPLTDAPPPLPEPERAVSPREAALSPSEVLPVRQCIGRVCADLSVSCPPAVPIVMCGERITAGAVSCMEYYGTEQCAVLRQTGTTAT